MILPKSAIRPTAPKTFLKALHNFLVAPSSPKRALFAQVPTDVANVATNPPAANNAFRPFHNNHTGPFPVTNHSAVFHIAAAAPSLATASIHPWYFSKNSSYAVLAFARSSLGSLSERYCRSLNRPNNKPPLTKRLRMSFAKSAAFCATFATALDGSNLLAFLSAAFAASSASLARFNE